MNMAVPVSFFHLERAVGGGFLGAAAAAAPAGPDEDTEVTEAGSARVADCGGWPDGGAEDGGDVTAVGGGKGAEKGQTMFLFFSFL